MLVSKMPLYHIWRGSESLGHVRVTITRVMVEWLVARSYASNRDGTRHPYPSIILCADGKRPETISDTDGDASYVLGELSPGLISELNKLKAKLHELGAFQLNSFVIPGEPNAVMHTPFKVFEYRLNRLKYMVVSEKMAKALTDAQYPDFLYNRRPNRNGNEPCVRLSESYRLFDWNEGGDCDVMEVQPLDLHKDELNRYYELLHRLDKFGYRPTCMPAKTEAKEQSFTEALYNDRKAAAVKAAQSAIAKDIAVNAIVDVCTGSDNKMLNQRNTLLSALPARCYNLIADVNALNRTYGWPEEDIQVAAAELRQACLKFEKLYLKKHPKVEKK